MVTANKVRCIVVVATPEGEESSAAETSAEARFRPSDLLPWADPHIRSLVEQLQKEVRQEQLAGREVELPKRSRLDDLSLLNSVAGAI